MGDDLFSWHLLELFWRFSLAGGVSTLTYWALYSGMLRFLKGEDYLKYSIVATIPGIALHYFLQRMAFDAAGSNMLVQLIVFFVKDLSFMGVNTFMLYLAVRGARLGPMAAQVVVTPPQALLSFILTPMVLGI